MRLPGRTARNAGVSGELDEAFPPGFFNRVDEAPDAVFYRAPRLVTHIDARAIAAVGALYDELGLRGAVLDLMASWISHFRAPPDRLVGIGLNAAELAANRALAERHVQDLNAHPRLPLEDDSLDGAVCCVSVDYLTRPLTVFREVGRCLRPGAPFVVTFSNRLFPTKAVLGWRVVDDAGRMAIVEDYFRRSGRFDAPEAALRTPPGTPGDPLWAVWARSAAG
jgi:SAM-dependent methyltransferase